MRTDGSARPAFASRLCVAAPMSEAGPHVPVASPLRVFHLVKPVEAERLESVPDEARRERDARRIAP
jgi:hypothetical protein